MRDGLGDDLADQLGADGGVLAARARVRVHRLVHRGSEDRQLAHGHLQQPDADRRDGRGRGSGWASRSAPRRSCGAALILERHRRHAVRRRQLDRLHQSESCETIAAVPCTACQSRYSCVCCSHLFVHCFVVPSPGYSGGFSNEAHLLRCAGGACDSRERASARVCPGRRRELHRHDSGSRDRHQRRRAAGRHRDGDQPVDDRDADAGHQRERLVPLSRGAARRLLAHLRARRASPASSAKASRSRSGSPPMSTSR